MTCLLPERVVQLHPSTYCNLSCAHCYSSSAPGRTTALDPAKVVGALAVLAEAGYEILSVSGGEPFLYAPLAEVAAEARRLGYRVTVVTNGAAVTPAKAASVADTVRTAAVSLDGRPDRHDAIRGKVGSFDLAVRGLRRLKSVGMTCGVITCVTRLSLPDVPWLYEIARSEGASLFQLRPLALTGRGAAGLDDVALDADDAVRLAVVAALLGDADDVPFVQCDLAPAADLVATGPAQFALTDGEYDAHASLSDLVNPLVVCEDGAVRPFVYGMADRYQLTTVDALVSRAWCGLRDEQRADLASLLSQTFTAVAQHPSKLVDWYAILTDVSHRTEVALRLPASVRH